MSSYLPDDRAFFRATTRANAETLFPLEAASSNWNPDHIRGPALTPVLVRAAERAAAVRPGVRPARAMFEFFRPSHMVPSRTETTLVRNGRRTVLIDAFLIQADEAVARAQIMFLEPGLNPAGALWSPQGHPEPPSVDQAPDRHGRLYRSGEGHWTDDSSSIQNCLRKEVWQVPTRTVVDEEATVFQHVASAADMASLVSHAGPEGISFINTDLWLGMARAPVGPGVGIVGSDRGAFDGIGVGAATLYDRAGRFGHAAVSALVAQLPIRPA